MAKGVEKTIEDVKKARKHFESFEQQFTRVGDELKRAQNAFEKANTHLGRYGGSIVRLTGDTPGSELIAPPGAERAPELPFAP